MFNVCSVNTCSDNGCENKNAIRWVQRVSTRCHAQSTPSWPSSSSSSPPSIVHHWSVLQRNITCLNVNESYTKAVSLAKHVVNYSGFDLMSTATAAVAAMADPFNSIWMTLNSHCQVNNGSTLSECEKNTKETRRGRCMKHEQDESDVKFALCSTRWNFCEIHSKIKLIIYLAVAHVAAASITIHARFSTDFLFLAICDGRRMCWYICTDVDVRHNYYYWHRTLPFLGHGTRFMDAANNEHRAHTHEKHTFPVTHWRLNQRQKTFIQSLPPKFMYVSGRLWGRFCASTSRIVLR